ncbi:MAG: peptidoglycan editing factor PgeF [Cyanobacteria bacterium J06635_15]
MHTWHWQSWDGAPFLTCDLLADWPHGFFTHQFWPQTPETLIDALQPSATVHRVKQVHGNTVLTPAEMPQTLEKSPAATAVATQPPNSQLESPPESLPQRPPADGIVTDAPIQSAWVCSADCNPVLIANCQTRQVAAIHAGWRGTALKIIPVAVQRLLQHGSQIQDLRVAIGPAIAGEVYQVSTHVAAEVGQTVVAAGQFTNPDDLLQYLRNLDNPPVLNDTQPGRARLDVRRINVLQLKQLGFIDAQIAIAPHCTYQEPGRFFSYRRTQEKKVQWSGIVSQ